ncbi:MAG: hypothetical protein OEW48_13625 [Phycisphaerae bacterium]|nr:hypothetical protein [Phycisphaerae bacterium]
MRKQSILVLVIFVLVVAPAVTAIWIQVVPEYQARAEVRVRRPIIVNTQVSIIRSSAVLQRVWNQQEVQETQWYKKPRKSLVQRLLGNQPASPTERLRDDLSVWHRKETEIIDVTFMDSSAKDAKLILDTVLNQYIRYIGVKSDSTKDKLYLRLVDECKSLENEIQEIEKQQAEFQGLFESAQLLEKENNDLRLKRELFNRVRQRLDQENMKRNVPIPIEVLSSASVSSKPYKDRRIVFTAMALVIGSIGVGFTGWLLRRKRML